MKKPPTLLNPHDPNVPKTVAIYRDGADGRSTSRTVWRCTPTQLRDIVDKVIQGLSGNGKADTE